MDQATWRTHRKVYDDGLRAMLTEQRYASPRGLTVDEVERGKRQVEGHIPYTTPEAWMEMVRNPGAACGAKGGCDATE